MKLKELRKQHNYKSQEVAEYLNCSPAVYSRYESGEREPSLETLLKLSELYNISVDYLIGHNDVVGTSITKLEALLIGAVRYADERAIYDALTLLERHRRDK